MSILVTPQTKVLIQGITGSFGARHAQLSLDYGTQVVAGVTPGKGGQMVRSAGMSSQLVGIEGDYALIKLPSGEIRKVLKECAASIGIMGNPDRRLIRWGKAGRMRLRGIKPRVKGKNMNPVDHPHGGGEGHSPIGQKRGPQTVYGKPARGVRTRKPTKWSNKFIVKSRRSKLI